MREKYERFTENNILFLSSDTNSYKSQLFKRTNEESNIAFTTSMRASDFTILELPCQDQADPNDYSELCKTSSLLWWKRFFDMGFYMGQIPYRIVPKTCNPYEFTFVESQFNKILSATCQILTLLGSWNILAQMVSSAQPRIPNLLSWVSSFGTFCIQLSLYYTIWFQKARIIHVLNTYASSWKRYQEKRHSRYWKPRRRTLNQIHLTTCYSIFFCIINSSYFYELGWDGGWSFKNIFFRNCAYDTLSYVSETCSNATILWRDVPHTVVKFLTVELNAFVAVLCDMFFLSSCIFYGKILDEMGQFSEEDDYETAEEKYTRLRILIRALNDAAGFAAIMLVAGGMPFYVGQIPVFAGTYVNNTLDISHYRLLIFFTYYFGIFFWTSLKFSNVEHRLKLWAEEHDMISSKMTIPFTHQVFHMNIQRNTQLEFSPCGIFKLNYEFCKGLLSFAATYSIILVQLGQGNSADET